jgi:hypothetical protein
MASHLTFQEREMVSQMYHTHCKQAEIANANGLQDKLAQVFVLR